MRRSRIGKLRNIAMIDNTINGEKTTANGGNSGRGASSFSLFWFLRHMKKSTHRQPRSCARSRIFLHGHISSIRMRLVLLPNE